MPVCVWLASLSMLTSRPIHVAANGIISFLFVTEQDSFVHHIFLIHSSVDGHLGCYHEVLNIRVNVSFWIRVFSRCVPRCGIAGSYGKGCSLEMSLSRNGKYTYGWNTCTYFYSLTPESSCSYPPFSILNTLRHPEEKLWGATMRRQPCAKQKWGFTRSHDLGLPSLRTVGKYISVV